MHEDNMINVRITLEDGVKVPEYAHFGDSGFDLRSNFPHPVTIYPGRSKLIPTGITMEVPKGFELQIRPRSGLANMHRITPSNSPGTIDATYRGEIKVSLANEHHDRPYTIHPGDKIAQAVLSPVFRANFIIAESLDETDRGSGGFGSTGK